MVRSLFGIVMSYGWPVDAFMDDWGCDWDVDCGIFEDCPLVFNSEEVPSIVTEKPKEKAKVFRPFVSLGTVEMEVKRLREIFNKRQ